MNKNKRVALLISGGGTTAQAVIEACKNNKLEGIEIVTVISNKRNAGGIEKANKLGIPTYILAPSMFASQEKFGEALLQLLEKLSIDLISQNGWLLLTPKNVVAAYTDRIINQHPGPLDPGRGIDFGGKGMYGARVICARVAYIWITGEEKWTEATVHYVTDKFDEGNIIQTSILDLAQFYRPQNLRDLQNNPTTLVSAVKQIQKELLPLEHENVIQTLRQFGVDEKVTGHKRQTPLIPTQHSSLVEDVKKLALTLFPQG